MKYTAALFLFGAVGLISACSVNQKIVVQHEKLSGRWHEKLALGDDLMDFFSKCVTDDISIDSSGTITKTRSYLLKWFPWVKWNSQSSLEDKGAKWRISESGFLGLGHTTKDLAIVAMESDFVIVKTCPNEWLSSGDRVWVYWRTNADLGKTQLDMVQQALDQAEENYKVTDFKTVNQSNC